jgi:hypothetical protein
MVGWHDQTTVPGSRLCLVVGTVFKQVKSNIVPGYLMLRTFQTHNMRSVASDVGPLQKAACN